MAMRQIPIKMSSNIAAAAYDEETLDLLINFKSKSTYIYHQVPNLIVSGLIQANSPGKFLNQTIARNPQFAYERVS